MTLTTQVVSVGTATTTLVPPTLDAALVWLHNLESSDTVTDKIRSGEILAMGQKFQVAGNTNVYFSLLTGSKGIQFDYYRIVSENHNVTAELIESPTVTTTGNEIPAYNLNRNFPDTYESEFKSASAVSGGTVISREVIIASSSTGGLFESEKILTLKPNTQYAMKFDNTESGTTEMFLEIGFSEIYNGANNVWINNSVGNAAVLRGGDKIQLKLNQSEGLTATASRNGVKVAVMRQD